MIIYVGPEQTVTYATHLEERGGQTEDLGNQDIAFLLSVLDEAQKASKHPNLPKGETATNIKLADTI